MGSKWFFIYCICFLGTLHATAQRDLLQPNTYTATPKSLLNYVPDFTATDSLGNTLISLYINDSIYIKTPDGFSKQYGFNFFDKQTLSDDSLVMYKLRNASNELPVIITLEKSVNSILQPNYHVKLTVGSKPYEGKGKYYFSPSLTGKWDISTENNAKNLTATISANHIEFYSTCQNLQATLQVAGKYILYTINNELEKKCKKNYTNSNIDKLKQNQGKWASFYISKNHLYLYLIDDSTLVFEKN